MLTDFVTYGQTDRVTWDLQYKKNWIQLLNQEAKQNWESQKEKIQERKVEKLFHIIQVPIKTFLSHH